MRIKCVKDNAESFSKKHFEIGFTPKSEFNLVIGEEYIVYSINMWRGVVSYLVIGDRSERPSWYPSEAFEIINNSIPENWFFATFRDDDNLGVQMILGYDEMVNSIDIHYDGLIERDVEALKTFFKRKIEIDSAI